MVREELTISDTLITLRLALQTIPIQVLDDLQHEVSPDPCQLLLQVRPQLIGVYPASLNR